VPRLIVIKGTDEGRQFALNGDLLPAGRDSSSRIRLTDTEASRRHAEFVRTADGYRVRDVGSANGTFVNNQSVRDALLQPGDHVQIGQTILVYTLDRGEQSPSTDLADRISLISRHEGELSSAIVKTIGETEGSRILAHPEQVEGPWLKSALANLGVMYEATQTISHTLDIEQLLQRILDLIFKTIQADRGCFMLRIESALQEGSGSGPDPGSPSSREFEPKAVRWRDAPGDEKLPISRTIVDYVLQEKKGILVSDAMRDERFQAVQSIVRSGIREVICVPMKGRHQTLGVLYLDTSTPAGRLAASGLTGKFSGDHLALAIAIAHQAALAVEETRYHHALVNAERLAAIGQTIAALSHHIKNILQGLRSGGDILKMGLASMDQPLLQQGWKLTEKNLGKIQDLVLDMLSYSKEREPNVEPTDLNSVVRDLLGSVVMRAKEMGVQLKMRLDASLTEVPVDPNGIHHALLNLVGNALDAVEDCENPKVVVRTEREPIVDVSKGAWVRIQVEDNGHGIPPEKLADIFRPFVSTKGAKGTGLGLAVSRKILREHGGDIRAESTPGQGSRFTMRLPMRSPLGDSQGTQTELPVVPPEAD
jgi:signal transduction histidine kinase/pSer/pThr/pTyr-binding forkhead associated (FHA) protein